MLQTNVVAGGLRMFTAIFRHVKYQIVAIVVLAGLGAGPVVAQPKAHITIYSEETETHGSLHPKDWEVLHSGILIEYSDGTPEWVGFHSIHHEAKGPGEVDYSTHEKYIKSYVRFEVNEYHLKNAREAAVKAFEKTEYVFGAHDCVSFSEYLCKHAGLEVPGKPNLLPKSLVEHLVALNKERLAGKFTHVPKADKETVFPWQPVGKVWPDKGHYWYRKPETPHEKMLRIEDTEEGQGRWAEEKEWYWHDDLLWYQTKNKAWKVFFGDRWLDPRRLTWHNNRWWYQWDKDIWHVLTPGGWLLHGPAENRQAIMAPVQVDKFGRPSRVESDGVPFGGFPFGGSGGQQGGFPFGGSPFGGGGGGGGFGGLFK
jgi:uncharacterized membrane protein YgcG